MKLRSPSFSNGGKIPSLFTCDGNNINPELRIENVPEKTESLVLIMDDPDVPEYVRADRMWVHWIVFNIPSNVSTIPEDTMPAGIAGKGTAGKSIYQGPCPPDREHRYYFKLYALNTMLDLPEGATKQELEKAMEKHVIAHCELMGTYVRPSNVDK